MRRRWGFVLSGALAIDVPAFRTWLTERFPRDQHGLLTNAVIARHIGNFSDMLFAVEDGRPPYGMWVAKIRERLAVIPDTVEDLLQAERAQSPGLMLLWDENYSDPAWGYFRAWATGQKLDIPPPSTSPTGQIVYAAANDPS